MTTLRTPAGVPIAVCKDREQVTRALVAFRHFRGISQVALDDKAGWTDCYTSKLEQPFSGGEWKNRTGRCAMHASFDEWLQALGVRVLIVPAESELSCTQKAPGDPLTYRLTLPDRPLPKVAARRRTKATRTKRTHLGYAIEPEAV